MKKIIAIGGGEIGRQGFKPETTAIDREIIRLSGKAKPRALFVPTASGDAPGYVENFNKHYGGRLGCLTDSLQLVAGTLTRKQIREKIESADIIYVGGGNTLKMVTLWRRLGVDKLLFRAYRDGKVMSGLSAGCNCWFRQGNSDARRFADKHDSTLIKVTGLNLIDALACPHYDIEKPRQQSLKRMMRNTPGVAIALDNCAALEVIDDGYRVITSKKTACARKIYWQKGKYHNQIIPQLKEFQPISSLLSK
ncbi:type 1 glutamine amidotransferase-like domain-containing protein [Candidatus Falkowbacteria bacterium]|nr:type 1 glutamine amidotransferase-like domain-containing protein [Candidatus Falkowbacteria bacterium]